MKLADLSERAIVMALPSTGYPPSEAACYAAIKLMGVPDLPYKLGGIWLLIGK